VCLRRTWRRSKDRARERMWSAAHLSAYWLPLSPSTATAALPSPRSPNCGGAARLTAASFFLPGDTMGWVGNVGKDISERQRLRRRRAWRPSMAQAVVVVGDRRDGAKTEDAASLAGGTCCI
jgi:hypothetical protein